MNNDRHAENQFDFLLLISNFGINNGGYVDKHIIYLAEQLKLKGYKVAILILPSAGIAFLNLLLHHRSISFKYYLTLVAYDLLFFSNLTFSLLFRTLGRKNGVSWKSHLYVKIYFSKIKLLKKAKRVIFNSIDVALFLRNYRYKLENTYYIIYHNQENDFPKTAQMIWDLYNYPFRKVVTNDEMLGKFGLDRACKINPAIDPTMISASEDYKKIPNTVLIPLRKSPIKGAVFAVEAIKKLLDKSDEITVYTFGNYPSVYVHPRCVNFGVVSNDQLKKLYIQSEIFILPSIEDGVPGPALEAMANGCAVICTNVSGAREIITDGFNGTIIPSGDPNIMADKIAELVKDKELIEKYRKNSKSVQRKFSPENMADTFLEAIRFYES